ncbi:MAG: aspartate carbamoyltransferase catalytic subunit [Candidatus Saelkia tenebricola]|nr:aspartate carbamoyltransferase catalytic subunit [Candidatus Saelkia tenebricola]
MVDLNLIKEFTWSRKHLLGLESLEKIEIEHVLELAKSLKEILNRPVKKVPALRGKTIALLFYEPSTRTRISFELAAKRLSADTVNFSVSSSSVVKGESLKDTGLNIEAMNVDIIVVRNSSAGTAHYLSKNVSAGIINAGDGMHEHPTQALLDLFTILEYKKKISNLTVAIVGDIAHSRVARSNIYGLKKMGARVILCGPPTMLLPEFKNLGIEISYDLNRVLECADVLNVLRIQKERINESLFPSMAEYREFFGVTRDRLLKYARPGLLILHPGPVNRGVELSPDVLDKGLIKKNIYSVVLNQVTNGLAVRMAILYLISGVGGKVEAVD